jgi:hypothetical protein
MSPYVWTHFFFRHNQGQIGLHLEVRLVGMPLCKEPIQWISFASRQSQGI